MFCCVLSMKILSENRRTQIFLFAYNSQPLPSSPTTLDRCHTMPVKTPPVEMILKNVRQYFCICFFFVSFRFASFGVGVSERNSMSLKDVGSFAIFAVLVQCFSYRLAYYNPLCNATTYSLCIWISVFRSRRASDYYFPTWRLFNEPEVSERVCDEKNQIIFQMKKNSKENHETLLFCTHSNHHHSPTNPNINTLTHVC